MDLGSYPEKCFIILITHVFRIPGQTFKAQLWRKNCHIVTAVCSTDVFFYNLKGVFTGTGKNVSSLPEKKEVRGCKGIFSPLLCILLLSLRFPKVLFTSWRCLIVIPRWSQSNPADHPASKWEIHWDLIFFFSSTLISSGIPVTTHIQHPEHKGEKKGRFIVPDWMAFQEISFPGVPLLPLSSRATRQLLPRAAPVTLHSGLFAGRCGMCFIVTSNHRSCFH